MQPHADDMHDVIKHKTEVLICSATHLDARKYSKSEELVYRLISTHSFDRLLTASRKHSSKLNSMSSVTHSSATDAVLIQITHQFEPTQRFGSIHLISGSSTVEVCLVSAKPTPGAAVPDGVLTSILGIMQRSSSNGSSPHTALCLQQRFGRSDFCQRASEESCFLHPPQEDVPLTETTTALRQQC